MSVIGRLDEQVDAVLIAPLNRNRPPQTAAQKQPSDEQASQSPTGLQTPEDDESSQNERAEREGLPVWLL